MELLETYFTASFQWVLRATFQGSLLVCLILAIKLALRERLPARWHYCLWLVLLVRLVLPWAPQSRLSIYNLVPQSLPSRHAIPADGAHSEAVTAKSGAAEQEGTTGLVLTDTQDETPQQGQDTAAASPSPTVASQQSDAVSTEGRRPFVESAAAAAPWLWLAGCLLLGGYILGRAFALWWAVRSERPVTDQQILDLLEDCKMQMGVRTIVGVVVTDRTRSPALFGFLRPRILLPDGLIETLSLDELHYVFLHELAHLRRRDIYLAWLVCLVQVLHWFNPLMWYAFRRMRADQEMAADALALSAAGTDESHRYGRTIVGLLERFSRPQYLPSLAGILENRSHIERRMTMIAKFKGSSSRWSPLGAILISLLACVVLPDAPRTEASMASSVRQPTLRRIEVSSHGPMSPQSSPSLDGKYMASLARTGNLVIKELATGTQWDLTKGGGVSGVGVAPLIAPDNTKVVYYWFVFQTQKWEGRVAALDGSQDRLLLSGEKIPGWLYADVWSPDGRFLFGRHGRPDMDTSARLVKVSVDDGSIQTIGAVDANGLSKVDVSPDGRFLAYDRRDKATSKRDVFVFDLAESRESILVRGPADDKLLGWTPDGQHIFFASDRTGTMDGWLLPVQDGKSKGQPTMIRPGMGDVVPVRFTQAGSLYYLVQREAWNVYTVELDLEEGKALSEPTAVRDMGKDSAPDWSPDGRHLAYCSQPDASKPQVIRIRTLATGEEREISPDLPHFNWLRWCLDSQHLLVPYASSRVAQVDIQTGEYTDLITATVTRDERIRQAETSSDGRTLVYRIQDGANGNRIIIRDLTTGKETVLVHVETLSRPTVTGGNGWTLLPDSRRIAVSMSGLRIVSSESGQTKIIVPDKVGHLTLANNTRDLLFVRDSRELWRVAIDGSEPQKVWQWEQMILEPRMHPDGRHLAFVSGSETSEMWVMENFLPTAAVAAEQSQPQSQTTLRKLPVRTNGFANISPDGRFLCDLEMWTGNLVICDLATASKWPVTGNDSSGDDVEYALDAAISPDSRKVAYLWYDPNTEASSLWLAGIDGSDRKLLCKDIYAMPRDWSTDGSKILAIVYGKPHRMVWISASDGAIQQIKDIGKEYPGKFDVSPDGRFIAYDRPQAVGTSKRDVFGYDIALDREICLINHPADDVLLGWTPDAKGILFLSDRAGTWDAWLINAQAGKPDGIPWLVRLGLGKVDPVGFGPDGEYYFAVSGRHSDVYTSSFESGTGSVSTLLNPVGHTAYRSHNPQWSADGRYLAYCYFKRKDGGYPVIRIRSWADGQERELDPSLPGLLDMRFAPDGRSFVMSRFYGHAGEPQVIYEVDAQTGKSTELVRSEDARILYPQWFPDGKRLLYLRRNCSPRATDDVVHGASLIVRDTDTGREKEIIRTDPPETFLRCELSPDGHHVVVQTAERGVVTKLVSVDSGQSRELLGRDWQEHTARVTIACWSPGSRSIFLRVEPNAKSGVQTTELWRISIQGGQPEKLQTFEGLPLVSMRVHPSGKHVALGIGQRLSEFWVIENFLPGMAK